MTMTMTTTLIMMLTIMMMVVFTDMYESNRGDNAAIAIARICNDEDGEN